MSNSTTWVYSIPEVLYTWMHVKTDDIRFHSDLASERTLAHPESGFQRKRRQAAMEGSAGNGDAMGDQLPPPQWVPHETPQWAGPGPHPLERPVQQSMVALLAAPFRPPRVRKKSTMGSDAADGDFELQAAPRAHPARTRHTPGNEELSSDFEDAPQSEWPPRKAAGKRKASITKPPGAKARACAHTPSSCESDASSEADAVVEATKKPTRTKAANTRKASAPNIPPSTTNKRRATTAKAEPPMKWTLPLTAIALETRYIEPQFVKAFKKPNLSGSQLKTLWQKALNFVNRRALLEGAWGDGDERVISMKQYKNKIKAIKKYYKEKRKIMLQQTGNRTSGDSDEDDDSEYPELPNDFFLETDGNDWDPRNVSRTYVEKLGVELAPLWPLICACLHRVGCTGEAIVETGNGGESARGASATPVSSDPEEASEDEANVESVEDSRARAKKRAKTKFRTQPPRNIEVVGDALKGGFEMIGKALAGRNAAAPQTQVLQQLTDAVQSLSESIARTHEEHRAFAEKTNQTSTILCSTVERLQKTSQQTAELVAMQMARHLEKNG